MKRVLGFIIYLVLFSSLAYPICTELGKGHYQSNWFEYYVISATMVTFSIISIVIRKWVFEVLEIK